MSGQASSSSNNGSSSSSRTFNKNLKWTEIFDGFQKVVKFNGKNYDVWSRSIANHVRFYELEQYLTDENPVPCPEPRKLLSVITSTIAPELQDIGLNTEDPMVLWGWLKNQDKKDIATLVQLIQSLFDSKWELDNIVENIARFENTISSLEKAEVKIDATIKIAFLMKHVEKYFPDICIFFGNLLEPKFEEFKSQILAAAKKKIKPNEKSGGGETAFKITKFVGKCSRCLRPGHIRKDCQAKIQCKNCNKDNHVTEKCWHKKNANKEDDEKDESKSQSSKPSIGVAFFAGSDGGQFFKNKNNRNYDKMDHKEKPSYGAASKAGMQSSKNIVTVSSDETKCQSCILDKQWAFPHKNNIRNMKYGRFESIHIGLMGEFKSSLGNSKYILVVVCESTDFTICCPVKSKDDVFDMVKNVVIKNQNQFDVKVKRIHSDGGEEFKNDRMNNFCIENGIIQTFSTESTGIVERKSRTLLDRVKILMNEAKLPKYLYAEMFVTVAYLTNRWKTADGKSPFEKLFLKKQNIDHLRTIGCIAYTSIPKNNRKSKLDEVSKKLVFVGYTPSSTSYRMFDPVKKQIIISHDVKFDEDNYFFNDDQYDGDIWANKMESNPFFKHIDSDDDESNYDRNGDNVSNDDENRRSSNECENIEPTSSSSISGRGNTRQVGVDCSRRTSTRCNKGCSPSRYQSTNAVFFVSQNLNQELECKESEKSYDAINDEKSMLKKYGDLDDVKKSGIQNDIELEKTERLIEIKSDGKYKARLAARSDRQELGVKFTETIVSNQGFQHVVNTVTISSLDIIKEMLVNNWLIGLVQCLKHMMFLM